ncbi:hypothetical protein GCM10007298_04190 [Williamsia phyllosphaerae]|uniref:Uncharacterized protein n=1 Tax=Williamsia phyllosphaerae TaxID=885042 RepID=A0ABQ1U5Z6_9NOCA|nr:hypothetical protein GCM10007298_04190 [Williamsia phyllosphaerae]
MLTPSIDVVIPIKTPTTATPRIAHDVRPQPSARATVSATMTASAIQTAIGAVDVSNPS